MFFFLLFCCCHLPFCWTVAKICLNFIDAPHETEEFTHVSVTMQAKNRCACLFLSVQTRSTLGAHCVHNPPDIIAIIFYIHIFNGFPTVPLVFFHSFFSLFSFVLGFAFFCVLSFTPSCIHAQYLVLVDSCKGYKFNSKCLLLYIHIDCNSTICAQNNTNRQTG